MSKLFLTLLNLSLTAGWIILAVFLLRFALKKAPRWITCALWGVAALRLIFPFSVESVLSLLPSTRPLQPEILYSETPRIQSGVPFIDQVVNPVMEETFAPAPEASVNPLQVITEIAGWIWLVGCVILLGYAGFTYLRLRRRMADSVPLRDEIRQSEKASSPFILGIFRPRIYLPFGLDPATQESVVAHEYAHLKRRDYWIKPFAFLLLSVYWFHPLIWLGYILLCRDIEIACDEKVIRSMSEDERKQYATALLECGVRKTVVAACPLAFGEVGVKQRIKRALNYKKPLLWVIIAALVAVTVISVCLLTDPKREPSEDPDPQTSVTSGTDRPVTTVTDVPNDPATEDPVEDYSVQFFTVGYSQPGLKQLQEIAWNIRNDAFPADSEGMPALQYQSPDKLRVFLLLFREYFTSPELIDYLSTLDAEFFRTHTLTLAYAVGQKGDQYQVAFSRTDPALIHEVLTVHSTDTDKERDGVILAVEMPRTQKNVTAYLSTLPKQSVFVEYDIDLLNWFRIPELELCADNLKFESPADLDDETLFRLGVWAISPLVTPATCYNAATKLYRIPANQLIPRLNIHFSVDFSQRIKNVEGYDEKHASVNRPRFYPYTAQDLRFSLISTDMDEDTGVRTLIMDIYSNTTGEVIRRKEYRVIVYMTEPYPDMPVYTTVYLSVRELPVTVYRNPNYFAQAFSLPEIARCPEQILFTDPSELSTEQILQLFLCNSDYDVSVDEDGAYRFKADTLLRFAQQRLAVSLTSQQLNALSGYDKETGTIAYKMEWKSPQEKPFAALSVEKDELNVYRIRANEAWPTKPEPPLYKEYVVEMTKTGPLLRSIRNIRDKKEIRQCTALELIQLMEYAAGRNGIDEGYEVESDTEDGVTILVTACPDGKETKHLRFRLTDDYELYNADTGELLSEHYYGVWWEETEDGQIVIHTDPAP